MAGRGEMLPRTRVLAGARHGSAKLPMLLDGRFVEEPNVIPLPIDIFHSSFAKFRDAMNRNLVKDEDVVHAFELVAHASKIFPDELARQPRTRSVLKKIIGCPLHIIQNANKTTADHISTHNCSGRHSAILLVVQEKLDMGASGEASTQGISSHVQAWAQETRATIRAQCSCPSFVVSLSDPWLVVCGVIIADSIIVNRLTDYVWLGHDHKFDDSHKRHVARVLAALRVGLDHLQGKFDEPLFGMTSNKNFNFPLATCYLREDGKRVKFKYLEWLKEDILSCAIFKVQVVNDGDDSGDEEEPADDEAEPTDDEENSADKEDETSSGRGSRSTVDNSSILVVKFVQRYGIEAHQALATAHLAPQLHYYGSIWPDIPDATPWRMVVMEFLEGRMLSEESSYSPAICEAIRKAAKLLHGQGLVHGDLRAPNIMVTPTTNGDTAKIVDFDWAGKHGEVKYPHDVNLHAKLGWARGVRALGLILPKHDMHMIKRYKSDSTV